jgi:hypothetical protein
LPGESDALANASGLAPDIDPGNLCFASVGTKQRREDSDRGRLAGSVGAEEAIYASRLDAKIDAAKSRNSAVALS